MTERTGQERIFVFYGVVDHAAECRPHLFSDLYGTTLFQNGVNQDIKTHQEFFASSQQHVKLEGRLFLLVPNEGGLRVKRVDGFR